MKKSSKVINIIMGGYMSFWESYGLFQESLL